MSKQHGKRYRTVAESIDRAKLYSLEEAVSLVKSSATAKFDETVDLAFKLGVDPRQADQIVRGTVSLPHGTGRDVRVIVFAQGEKQTEAKEAGAEEVGADELAEKIQGGWLDFDVAIATPDMMRVVGKLGRVLGPRGLMPSPKSGTVTMDVGPAVSEFKKGKIEYRTDRDANVHVPIGKVRFDEQQLIENADTVIDAIVRARPAAAKGTYMKSAAMSSTMGPSVRLDPVALTARSRA
ncbi:MAG: 50S ribosomal protein L1 [Candidatus Hydrogenedentes bacterium]|nr:50S ribosomal protein L1 [Candidatus Hydrogenedentota bacterium]